MNTGSSDIEVKLQDALRSDGYLSSSILEQREAIKWAAFSPDSRTAFLSVRSLQRILNCPDIRSTSCYERVVKNINLNLIHLRKR